LARLHREAGVAQWVELEELAFMEAKKKLAS
jgi:hypothetical protein